MKLNVISNNILSLLLNNLVTFLHLFSISVSFILNYSKVARYFRTLVTISNSYILSRFSTELCSLNYVLKYFK
jgi:hypothetical protein